MWSSTLPTPACRGPAALANQAVVTRNGPYSLVELEPLPPGASHRGPRRPCHPRAISSGHERYPADSHGHYERIAELTVGPWPGESERPETAWHTRRHPWYPRSHGRVSTGVATWDYERYVDGGRQPSTTT
jgi:hypothetical protein